MENIHIEFAAANVGIFRGQEIESFYPYAEVVFEIKDPSKHYHIPLLLNPFGYSTYRGS